MLPTHGFTAHCSPCSNQLPLQSLSSHCGRRSPIRCCTFHKSCCCCGQTALRLLRTTPVRDFNPAADNREPTHLLLHSPLRLQPPPDGAFSLQHESMLARACSPAGKTLGPCLEAWRFARAPPLPLRTTLLPTSQLRTPGRPAAFSASPPTTPLLLAASPLDYSRTISCITFPPLRLRTLPRTSCLQMSMSQFRNCTPGRASRGHSCFSIWVCRHTVSFHFACVCIHIFT